MKQCDVCKKEIPTDFINLLCLECYQRQAEENEARKVQTEEERKQVDAQIVVDEPSGKAAESLENYQTEEKQAPVTPQD